jgi:broad specificity phosphatase PhoE
MTVDWQIPPSLLEHLQHVPSDRPVVLLMRHSVRDALPPGDVGYALPITEVGQRLAIQLGEILGERLKTLHTSPLVRCVQTAEGLRDGSSVDLKITHDQLLGDPGVYVVDGERAWKHWQERGHEGVMEDLVAGRSALSGMAHPLYAARFLVHHMLSVASGVPGLHIFVTHDSLVTATAAQLIGVKLGPDSWPWCLESAFFWVDDDGVAAAYRGFAANHPAPLCRLDEENVVEFARREISATVGLNSGARFFLAGGAFKTLLTGRPPRDLDLWAPSEQDRTQLIQALDKRGAQRLAQRPYADGFSINGRVVEVPHKSAPATLEERLARFDIALSAVGVEHRPTGGWRAVINPRATKSVHQREVLLLKPLVNWKYALTTLERARRYADELGFVLPPEEEAEIWRVFSNQPEEMRQGMVERYKHTGQGSHGVIEEVACRFP